MNKQTRRGRPRQFDEDKTLDQIMQVFWRHGFAATSLDQIAEATGLNRPSLYAAFGTKKDMYLKIIARFAEQMHTYLRTAGQSQTGAHARLKAIMAAAIDLYTGQSPLSHAAYGCLAVSTLPTEIVDDSDFQSALSAVLKRMDNGFASLIRHEAAGRLDEKEIALASQQLSLLLHGLSIRARAGESTETLKNLANSAVDRLVPPQS